VSSERRLKDIPINFRKLQKAGVFLTTAEAMVFELMKNSNHKHFRAILPIIKERRDLLPC
jgi:hypothetical protein